MVFIKREQESKPLPHDFQTTLPDLLCLMSQDHPDKVWLNEAFKEGCLSKSWTWRQGYREIMAVAAALEDRFGCSNNGAILAPNSPYWFLADLATICSGNIVVPLFMNAKKESTKYILEFTDACFIFVGDVDALLEIQDVLPPEIIIISLPGVELDAPHISWEELVAEGDSSKPIFQSKADDIVSLVFTSGTTGRPKGVIQTHETLISQTKRIYKLFEFDGTIRFLSYLPLSHIAERQLVECASLVVGGEVYFNKSLESLVDDMARVKPIFFFGVPRVWEQIQQRIFQGFGSQEKFESFYNQDPAVAGQTIRSLLGLEETECCLTASAPIRSSLVQWYEALGIILLDGYGQTEAMSIISNLPWARRNGSIGRPLPGVECKISPENELLIKTKGTTPGYYKSPSQTESLIRNGWLHTGDAAKIDRDGFVFITGRLKDYFKTVHGKYVAPLSIEGDFCGHSNFLQCCVIGRGMAKTVVVLTLSEIGVVQSRDSILSSIYEQMVAVNSSVEKHAHLGVAIVSDEEWSVDNGYVTPTQKIIRAAVEKTYAKEAEILAATAAAESCFVVSLRGDITQLCKNCIPTFNENG
jgi:long-chain acyl-CoA synthetase